jgi:hypothetical protein
MRSTLALSATVLGLGFLAHQGLGLETSFLLPDAPGLSAPTAPAAVPQDHACFVRGDPAAASERPSPLGETTISLDGQNGKICYGRPSANGRAIMGGLVPYGAPWRLGANEATALHLPVVASVGGVELQPGSYSLFAVPGETEWRFVLNGNVERWGIPIDEAVRSADLGSFVLSTETTETPVEQLTFTWNQMEEGAGELVMAWETTRIRIPIRVAGD